MVAIQNIALVVVAAGSTLVSASCWSVTLKVRGLNNVWERATADTQAASSQLAVSTELEKYFPTCKTALQALGKTNLPQYHSEAGDSVVFVAPPAACTQEAAQLGTTKVENATFTVSGKNIVVAHPDPAFIKAFEGLFGSGKAA